VEDGHAAARHWVEAWGFLSDERGMAAGCLSKLLEENADLRKRAVVAERLTAIERAHAKILGSDWFRAAYEGKSLGGESAPTPSSTVETDGWVGTPSTQERWNEVTEHCGKSAMLAIRAAVDASIRASREGGR
jgi:hypothetical protein